MRMIKLHYDGWLALPTGMREALGLSSGNRVEVELVDGTLVLRPATKAEKAAADASAVSVREPPHRPGRRTHEAQARPAPTQ